MARTAGEYDTRALWTRPVLRDLGFHEDLEGLRGIAVALVVLFHARLLGVASGFVGVDAFYVLSGFLISGLLLRELDTTGRLDLVAFYARRARRILPAATVAIVAILTFGIFIVAPLDLPGLAVEATASGLFVGNVVFALRSIDYFAPASPSPFLHYWSLGVEEQFYLVWPLLLLFAWRIRRLHLVTFAMFAGSLTLAIALTSSQAPWAFYSLPTRAWQLALGALLAMHAPLLGRLPSAPVALGGWVGIAILGGAAFLLEPAVGYPGFAALVPTLGVGLVILASGRRHGPARVLAFAPLRFLGRISFSLYLYHWPVFVFAAIALGGLTPALSWTMVGVSIAVAIASWKLIEEPFRHARVGMHAPGRSLMFAASSVCAVVLAAQGAGLFGASAIAGSEVARAMDVGEAAESPAAAVPANAAPQESALLSVAPSAGLSVAATAPVPLATSSAAPTMVPAPRELRPRLADARYDGDALSERGCGLSLAGSQPPVCQLGVPGAAVTVALVGDSHAAQWFPALDAIAQQRGWRILPFTKDSCTFVDMRITSLHLEREYTECALWREQVVVALQRARPELIVVSSSRWVHPVLATDKGAQLQADAMVRLLRRMPSRVAIIADTPLNDEDIPACLSRTDRTVADCATPAAYALAGHLARDGRVAQALGATLIDPTVWLCGPVVCPAIIEWTIVYRDDHHLTATMARRLAPLLERGLLAALGSD